MIRSSPRYSSADLSEQEGIAADSDSTGTERFDQLRWEESRAEGDARAASGRAVLGYALIILAVFWVG
ncbi:MAG TPA: hypothetical protein VD768_00605, partial [Sphingomicrobium sp.]|nr:hypothetical protein [Sphingomicrobium sp.]